MMEMPPSADKESTRRLNAQTDRDFSSHEVSGQRQIPMSQGALVLNLIFDTMVRRCLAMKSPDFTV